MYSKNYSFRYGDLNFNNTIRYSAILDVLQDVSICHSDEMGYTREKLASLSVTWLLSGWKIKLLSAIDNKTTVTVKTAIMDHNRFQAIRKYEIWQNCECKVIAAAEWFTVDTEKCRLARVPTEITKYYETITEERNGLEITRLRGNKDAKKIDTIKVEQRDIDTNNHLNNVKSAEILFDYLSENMTVSEFQVTYKKQLYKNDVAKIYTQITEDDFCAELRNNDDDPCVLLLVK